MTLEKRNKIVFSLGLGTGEADSCHDSGIWLWGMHGPVGKDKEKQGWLTWLQRLIPQEKLGNPTAKIHLKDQDKSGFRSKRTS